MVKNNNVYRDIFEHLEWPLCLTEAETGTIIDVNAQGVALLGRSRQEIIGKRQDEFIPPIESSRNQDILSDLLKREQRKIICDAKIVRQNNEMMPVGILTSPLNINGHNLILTLINESEQKWVAHELWESEQRFRCLSDASFEGIGIFEKGVVRDANTAYAALFGYSPSEIIGIDALKFLAGESRHLALQKMSSAYKKPYEVTCVRKDGTRFTAEVSSKVTNYHGRKVVVAAIRDITERKLIEQRLRESEEKLHIMFESIGEGFINYELDGYIKQLNKSAVTLFGYDVKEELIGRNIIELIATKHRVRVRKQWATVRVDGRTRQAEYKCVKRNGEEFDAGINVAILKDKEGTPTGFIAVVRDITENKKIKANMQYYICQIIRAQEEERRRIARELHDETVQSLVSLAFAIDTLSKDNRRITSRATIPQLRELRDKTYAIMNDLRRFSHDLRPDVLDQLGLVPALDLLTDEIFSEAKIRAHLEAADINRRLSPEAELVLFRIAQEALRNIRKHSQATEALVKLDFGTDKVRLIISDNGKGFVLPQMLSDLARRGKLGLIGMQERIRLLNGTLSVESRLGEGTKIVAELHAN